MFSKFLDVAVAIVIRDGRVLVTLRRPDQPLPNLWEFPGGKINPGESPADAVRRELREETGLAVTAVGTLEPVTHDYGQHIVRLHPILCEAEIGEPRPVEVAACQWVTAAALQQLAMPPASGPIVQAVISLMETPRSNPEPDDKRAMNAQ